MIMGMNKWMLKAKMVSKGMWRLIRPDEWSDGLWHKQVQH